MKVRSTCRSCDGNLTPILSLGLQYVSDFPKPEDSKGTLAPLELVLCNQCWLLQLKHSVPPESMYRNYWYRSGTNKTMRDALADIANKAETLMKLSSGDSVLDIGCNDGTLLSAYKTGGLFKIGFDPAQNIAPQSKAVADFVEIGFFAAETYQAQPSICKLKPKVVTSIAMFYDLDDPNKFVADVKNIMDKDGLWIIQMSYLPLMLKTNELGNICHEHLEYYSIHSLEHLLNRHGFKIIDAELNDINGGSIRAYIRRTSADPNNFGDATYRKLAEERVSRLRTDEIKMSLNTPDAYTEFAIWAERIKNDVVGYIKSQVQLGKKVYIYGASTKGNTLLQYFGLDSTLITAAAERNPDKWGRVTVGTNIPIISEDEARSAKPDYFLVLPWHFIEEFKRREISYLKAGGRFILPAPYFTLI